MNGYTSNDFEIWKAYVILTTKVVSKGGKCRLPLPGKRYREASIKWIRSSKIYKFTDESELNTHPYVVTLVSV